LFKRSLDLSKSHSLKCFRFDLGNQALLTRSRQHPGHANLSIAVSDAFFFVFSLILLFCNIQPSP